MGCLIKEWKNVNGYESLYKVSNYGEVKVKRRVVYGIIDGERQPKYVTKEKIISPVNNGNGYLYVSLYDENGKKRNHYIHRLVAEAFIPNPDNLPQVNHLDYDRTNNRVTNLEWSSVLENIRFSLKNQPKTRKCFSSTGYKWIYKRGGKYRVGMCVDGKRVDKCFVTLEAALNYRNNIAKETGIECKDNIN